MAGIIPELLLFAYIGQTINNIQDLFNGNSEDKSFIYIFVVGFIIAAGIVTYVTILTKKIFQKKLFSFLVQKRDLGSS